MEKKITFFLRSLFDFLESHTSANAEGFLVVTDMIEENTGWEVRGVSSGMCVCVCLCICVYNSSSFPLQWKERECFD